MSATFRNSAITNTVGGSGRTYTKPTGTADGDFVFALVNIDGTGDSMGLPTGGAANWELIGTKQNISNGDTATVALYGHIAGASEPSTYGHATDHAGNDLCAVLASYSGVDISGGTVASCIAAQLITSADSASVPTSPVSMSASAITTTAANQLVVWGGMVDWNSASAAAFTKPTGTDQRATNTPASFVNGIICDFLQATAASTGAVVGTGTLASKVGNYFAFLVALKSAASAVSAAATDAATATDASTTQEVVSAAASDAATATDAATAQATYLRSATDAVTATDVASTQEAVSAAAIDSVTATDSSTTQEAVSAAAIDSVTTVDAAVATGIFAALAADAITAIDSASTLQTQAVAADDSVTPTDSADTSGSVFYCDASDSISATDASAYDDVGAYFADAADAIICTDEAVQIAILAVSATDVVVLYELVTLSGSGEDPAAVWNYVLKNGLTAEENMLVLVAVAAGKTTITPHGPGEHQATVTFRQTDDSQDVVVAEMDGSERVSVTITPGGGGGSGSSAEPDVVEFVAGMALEGHRAVRLLAGEAIYADNTVVEDANVVLGLTQSAVAEGELAQIQTSGLMTEPLWAWTPDEPVFVGSNGVLVQPSPVTGFSLVIGVATSATQIHIWPQMPLVLL